jgi:chaperonin cofactor prefoldin
MNYETQALIDEKRQDERVRDLTRRVDKLEERVDTIKDDLKTIKHAQDKLLWFIIASLAANIPNLIMLIFQLKN